MNIFSIYLEKFKNILLDLEKNNKIKLPDKLNNLSIELPPKNFDGDISFNAPLILSKINKKKPEDIASLLKTFLMEKFPEFKSITIAKPGFLNITFNDNFWKDFWPIV